MKKSAVTLHSAMGSDRMEQPTVDRHQGPELHEIRKPDEYGTMGDNSLMVQGIKAGNRAKLALTTCLEAWVLRGGYTL